MELTYEWQKYDHEYEKRIQDLKLFNGDIVMCCWPNAGKWHTMGTKDIGMIDDIDVAFVRLNKEENR
jgi:hypothetical protein